MGKAAMSRSVAARSGARRWSGLTSARMAYAGEEDAADLAREFLSQIVLTTAMEPRSGGEARSGVDT
jgi:hypothetical protein